MQIVQLSDVGCSIRRKTHRMMKSLIQSFTLYCFSHLLHRRPEHRVKPSNVSRSSASHRASAKSSTKKKTAGGSCELWEFAVNDDSEEEERMRHPLRDEKEGQIMLRKLLQKENNLLEAERQARVAEIRTKLMNNVPIPKNPPPLTFVKSVPPVKQG